MNPEEFNPPASQPERLGVGIPAATGGDASGGDAPRSNCALPTRLPAATVPTGGFPAVPTPQLSQTPGVRLRKARLFMNCCESLLQQEDMLPTSRLDVGRCGPNPAPAWTPRPHRVGSLRSSPPPLRSLLAATDPHRRRCRPAGSSCSPLRLCSSRTSTRSCVTAEASNWTLTPRSGVRSQWIPAPLELR